jgi:FKBP-type peptidyl-prolyl cis-trans isomerase
LKVRDLTYGSGAEAKAGSRLKVRYTGRLHNRDGTIFDSNLQKGMKVTLGLGKVIEGWDFGLLGARQGGIRELLIPASMGYPRGVVGKIPVNTTLYFHVEVFSVRSGVK